MMTALPAVNASSEGNHATATTAAATIASTVDAGILRKALRLVHCIQKERGASCAYRAAAAAATAYNSSSSSSNNNNNENTLHALSATSLSSSSSSSVHHSTKPLFPARRDTDRAFAMLLLHKNCNADTKSNMEKVTLDKIRNMVLEHKTTAATGGGMEDHTGGGGGIASCLLQQQQQQAHELHNTNTTNNPGFHQILVCFSTLIQAILHEYILKHTTATSKYRQDAAARRNSKQQMQMEDDSNGSSSSGGSSSRIPRVSSHQALKQVYHLATTTASPPTDTTTPQQQKEQHRHYTRAYSSDAAPTATMSQFSSSAPSRLPSRHLLHGAGAAAAAAAERDSSQQLLYGENLTADRRTTASSSSPPLTLRPSFERGAAAAAATSKVEDDDDEGGTGEGNIEYSEPVRFGASFSGGGTNTAGSADDDDEEYDDDEVRVVRLLNLLDTFVRLKESTGVERAILSSMLATAGQVDSRFLLTDLLLEVENQRRHVGKLAKLLPKTGVLYELVQELVSMSPQMKLLQNSISQGFDLDSLKSKFDSHGKLWNLLTLYIDKLHSLELIIVEEIESCVGIQSHDDNNSATGVVDFAKNSPERLATTNAADAASSTTTDRINWHEVFGMAIGSTSKDLRNRIESMPPNDIKQRLLAASRGVDEDDSPHEAAGGTSHEEQQDGVAIGAAAKGVDELLAELSKAPASKEWEIDLYEIRFLKRIGQGTAGTTYLADWSGLKVAVKVASISEMGLDGWRTEVYALQKLHHPNIIRLLGSVYHPSPLTFCLVLEYCDAGDLSEVLKRVAPNNFFFRVADGMAKGVSNECMLFNSSCALLGSCSHC